MKNVKQFFEFARERESIRLKRATGVDAPWTEDKVLRDFRFCNIFREDDRTTIWFRDCIREPIRNHPRVFMATVAFRWFNKIETGAALRFLTLKGWDRKLAYSALKKLRDGGFPVFTGAYIIKSPDGQKKLEGILDCIDAIDKDAHHIVSACCHNEFTLQEMHETLMEYPYMGPFMAYEVVTDLRHTYLLENATDIMSWASAGPGCARGLGWLAYDNPKRYKYQSHAAQERMVGLMIELLDCSRDAEHWPTKWTRWEMREVEHTLCEYDKWRRGHEGQRLKRRYP